ncbi:bifunctional 5,10-methylenetetrahydrofolate dehydrogenase/5,10-methenyltetrahydrofolate cyclohydrolase [Candidatus Fokinia crypta]|uniref:Bifunctional protein FolD n=1 Tax=Candidatus Fokinia crypta TaxID=1920990 RepID=A0ABZ0UNS5_9RICK|nr:bifunctional 5,10-methylenetetrahydrofolate dehydrogenase/5,10-methenyltetrahydrofolate cyclohydrolase [Candidatus Fokinia cryptica]WPX97781.1 Bifunctional protein FolD protein [Candidatus Fokinia cryptica]
MHSSKIINGTRYAEEIFTLLKEEIYTLKKLNIVPCITAIMVGNNPSSDAYVKIKKTKAKDLGIEFRVLKFEENIQLDELSKSIAEVNKDSKINGIILQMPLPRHMSKDSHVLLDIISPYKDIDALTTYNIGALISDTHHVSPCTPQGIMYVLKKVFCDNMQGMNAVVIGRSKIVGLPLSHMLLRENCTVSILHSSTKDITQHTKNADILIAAIGKKHFIKSHMIKEGACVIDVGITRYNSKLYGDVDFDDLYPKVSFISPVPGGVGPMTVAFLIKNAITLTKLQYNLPINHN